MADLNRGGNSPLLMYFFLVSNDAEDAIDFLQNSLFDVDADYGEKWVYDSCLKKLRGLEHYITSIDKYRIRDIHKKELTARIDDALDIYTGKKYTNPRYGKEMLKDVFGIKATADVYRFNEYLKENDISSEVDIDYTGMDDYVDSEFEKKKSDYLDRFPELDEDSMVVQLERKILREIDYMFIAIGPGETIENKKKKENDLTYIH